MMITAQDTTIASQITQDANIWNAANPGAIIPLVQAIDWGGVLFAEYTLTQGGNLAPFMPHEATPPNPYYPNGIPASAGDPSGFVTQLFENALGRAPTATDLTYYDAIIAAHASPLEGYGVVLIGVAMSPEAQAHNHLFV